MPTLLVADSFRVRCDPASAVAAVRGFNLHLDRFRRGVTEMLGTGLFEVGPDWREQVFEPFMSTVPEQITRGEAGFPRLELSQEQQTPGLSLAVRLRPLPPLTTRIDLVSSAFDDAILPWVKGPNLERHVMLNRRLGAEALLTGQDGSVLEGASTAIVWWSGATLCTVDSSSRVNSVCEALVTSLAKASGVAVHRSSITPRALAEHEVWALNALHGIRPVTRIDEVELAAPRSDRLAAFQRSLDETWQEVASERH